jgi:hypothetical protein
LQNRCKRQLATDVNALFSISAPSTLTGPPPPQQHWNAALDEKDEEIATLKSIVRGYNKLFVLVIVFFFIGVLCAMGIRAFLIFTGISRF